MNVETIRRRRRYLWYLRQRGTPMTITQDEFDRVKAKLVAYHSRGMSARAIGEQAGMYPTIIEGLISGKTKKMHRSIYNRLMKVTFEAPVHRSPAGRPTGSYIDSTGTRRRIRALQADGFPMRVIGGGLGVTVQAVSQLAAKESKVYAGTADAVARLYDDWLIVDPREKFGVNEMSFQRTMAAAKRAGYPNRGCWDGDTIDDPDAIPEWTGKCGTPSGAQLHRRYGIPMCQPCTDARNEYRRQAREEGKNT